MANNVIKMSEYIDRQGPKNSAAIDNELDWIEKKMDEVTESITYLDQQLVQALEACKELVAYQSGIELLKKKDLANMETLNSERTEES